MHLLDLAFLITQALTQLLIELVQRHEVLLIIISRNSGSVLAKLLLKDADLFILDRNHLLMLGALNIS
jgi:hypothetical protein